jgi:hypothetical protein
MKRLAMNFFVGAALCVGTGMAGGIQAADAAVEGSFVSGDTQFLWLPQAHVSKGAQEFSSKVAATSVDAGKSGAAAVMGDYVISLDEPGAFAAKPASQSASVANADGLAVAMNERSGQLVLVPPRIKVFGIQPAKAKRLAKRGGGEVTYASNADRTAIIRYASLAQAQTALAEFAKESDVEEASLDVIQHIYTAQ